MGEIETVIRTFHGWKCDKRNCTNEFRLDLPIEGYRYMAMDQLEANAEDAGWTFWVSRSRYVFCPDHGPSKSAKKMWQRKAKR